MDPNEGQAIEVLLGRWADGPGPLHRKLADALRQAIDRGHLAVGQRLPAERDLAARLSVSRSTVVAAYDSLRADGLLQSRQGSGTRVRGDASRRGTARHIPLNPVYRSLIEDHRGVISLTAAAAPAHPRVAEALRVVTEDDAAKLLGTIGYFPAGLPELREGIAELLTRDGLPTAVDQVVVTTGAQQAVNLAASVFVRPGDDVVVESPSLAGTLDIFRTRGGRFAVSPVDDDGVDVRIVRDIVARGRTGAIYVMPSYHNPTGVLMAERRRRALAELAATEHVPIVEDNALEHAPLDDERVLPIAAFCPEDAPVVSAGSISKVVWAGLRVGWLRGPAALMARVAELKAMSDLGSPLLEQAIAARLIPDLHEMRADNRTMLRQHLDVLTGLLAEHLPAWRWQLPRGGASLWVRLPAGTAMTFAQVALRHGVEIVPGEAMSATPDHRDHMRFPFAAPPPVLEETVRRLSAAWAAYTPRDEVRDTARPVIV
jgi:DNA-binding transcriptional MocR family regulator